MISEAHIESRMRNERTAIYQLGAEGEFRMSGGSLALRAIEGVDEEGPDRKRRLFRISRRKEVSHEPDRDGLSLGGSVV